MDIFKFGTESYVFARKTNWEKLKHWIKTLQEKKKPDRLRIYLSTKSKAFLMRGLREFGDCYVSLLVNSL